MGMHRACRRCRNKHRNEISQKIICCHYVVVLTKIYEENMSTAFLIFKYRYRCDLRPPYPRRVELHDATQKSAA
jgi:hypothetical protein